MGHASIVLGSLPLADGVASGVGSVLGRISTRGALDAAVDDAASGGSRIAANQAAGNAARDSIAAENPGSDIEQTFSTGLGPRRIDVLTNVGLGIEVKVGRTSLTSAVQAQIAKDSWLLLNEPDVSGIQWVFSRSAVTGQIGPTGPLAGALDKAGIPRSLQ